MIIHCINVNRVEACAFYRSFGPMSELHKLDKDIRMSYFDRFNLLESKGCDVVIFQRPMEEDHLNQIKQIKKLGIPLIIDYDDNMMQIPEHNPFRKLQELQDNDYKTYVKMFCYLADQIWVTTEHLKNELSPFNENIKVIPNAFDDYLYKPATTSNKTKTILWRGSMHHEQDLATFKDELTELIVKNKDFTFVFMGEKFPKWLKDLAAKVTNMGQVHFVNVYEYPYTLSGLRPALMLVPLEDIPFNRSKSDINLLEAVVAGSNAITPNFPEWSWNKNFYDSPKMFYERTQILITQIRAGQFKQMDDDWQGLIQHVLKNRKLSDINKLRLDALKEIAI